MMGAELSREFFLVVTAVDSYGLESHPARVLNAEMSQSADAVHRNQLSGARA
jgi:hypothetical protein